MEELYKRCEEAIEWLRAQSVKENINPRKRKELYESWDKVYQYCLVRGGNILTGERIKILATRMDKIKDTLGIKVRQSVRDSLAIFKGRKPFK